MLPGLTFWAYHHLPMKVMKQKNTLRKFITNAETYLEPRRISTMELFGLHSFFIRTKAMVLAKTKCLG